MNPTNKRSHIHRANKKKVAEGDIDNKFDVIELLKEEFGLISALTDEIIPIPNGIAEYRQPDILIKDLERPIIIELMGGIHGFDDETVKRKKDMQKLEDYNKVPDYRVVLVYSSQTDGYNRQDVIETLHKQGVPIFLEKARAYRERKARCQRY